MKSLLSLLFSLVSSTLKERCDLALENLALRQQLAVLKRKHKRPVIENKDRLFWAWLSWIWTGWQESLVIVQPETVVEWHRRGFRLFWTKLLQRNVGGRPSVNRELKELIRWMTQANPLWGGAAYSRRVEQAWD